MNDLAYFEGTRYQSLRIQTEKEFDISKIEKGLISIHANWSGQSIINGKHILDTIQKSDFKNVEIHILDIDIMSLQDQIELIGDICHGYFESIWIERGEVDFVFKDNHSNTGLQDFVLYLKSKLS
ncbi:hypothetical protein [Aureibacter tunicatorum]|uniref:Uncharacterized protein n=1 Tax=Aureibacter tunicatorum TaxID=866807 RepID=A0AAE3XRC8_9BACT|nr:hypothetical protein [Aureibacter tunicatorum]MDR6240638.1 hypothetical protein [Aureibacter tunicatorum]BDD06501.1 hypothetical protein AUTU_39840 [Aureibacter tunicatorum]